jgi:hypothetical protein
MRTLRDPTLPAPGWGSQTIPVSAKMLELVATEKSREFP